jgi:predicted nucleotidyltransferase component of viral defense system
VSVRSFETRIRAVVRASAAPHNVVLRDYALSYLLAAIYGSDVGPVLAFKGGTALRKCYFRGYRFSEDLDFSLLDHRPETELERSMNEVCAHAQRLTAPFGRFRFNGQREIHRKEHPFRQIDFRIRVEYPTGASLPIKVEITPDEPIVLPLVRLNLIHLFEGEALEDLIQCYSLEEIAVEKLRAFLQARQNLKRREWVNRPRDLYDLWYLYRQQEQRIDWLALREPLTTKARARGVGYSGPDDFRDPKVLSEYRRQWEARLRGFVPQLPSFEEATIAFDSLLSELFA